MEEWFSRIHAEFHVLRATWVSDKEVSNRFIYGAVTLYGRSSQIVRLQSKFVTSRCRGSNIKSDPATPHGQRLPAYINAVWAIPRSLTTT